VAVKRAKYRLGISKNGLIVLRILTAHHELTAAEIVESSAGRVVTGSVHRALMSLMALGLVSRRLMPPGLRYSGNPRQIYRVTKRGRVNGLMKPLALAKAMVGELHDD